MLRFGQGHRTIWAFVAFYVVAGTVFGMLTLLLPVYAISLKATTEKVGLLRSALSLGVVATVLPAGFLIDRFGSRRLFITSGFLMAAAVAAMSWSREFIVLTITVWLMGAVSSFNSTAANAAFFGNLAKMGEEKTGWYKGSLNVGLSLLGPVIAGYVMSAYGFSATYALIAVLAVLPALTAMVLTGATPRNDKRSRRPSAAPSIRASHLLRNRAFVGAASLEGISIATVAIFSTFIAVLALSRLGLGVQHVGWLLSLEGIGSVILLFFGGKALAGIAPNKLILLGFAGTTAAFAIFNLTSVFAFIACASVILGLAQGLLGLTNTSSLAKIKADKGAIAGWHGLFRGVFGALGPLAAGLVGQTGGLQAIFWSVPIFYVVLTLLSTVRFGRRWLFVDEREAAAA